MSLQHPLARLVNPNFHKKGNKKITAPLLIYIHNISISYRNSFIHDIFITNHYLYVFFSCSSFYVLFPTMQHFSLFHNMTGITFPYILHKNIILYQKSFIIVYHNL